MVTFYPMKSSHGFTIAHAILFGVLAAFHVWVWARRGFYLPRYVHVLATMSAAVGGGMIWFLQQPIYQQTPPSPPSPARYLVVLLFPASVYGVFVLYGGAAAAPEPKIRRSREEPEEETVHSQHPLLQSQPFDASPDDRTRKR